MQRERIVEFEFHRKQEAVIANLERNNDCKQLLYHGNANCGKTFLGCYWQIERRRVYPKTRGIIARQELSNLMTTTWETFLEVHDMFFRKSMPYTFDGHHHVVRFHNKSKIYLKPLAHKPSDPDHTKFGGLEAADAFLDEVNEAPEKSVDKLWGRLRKDCINGRAKLLMSCNPNTSWVKDKWIFDEDGNRIVLPKGKVEIEGNIYDRPDKEKVQQYVDDSAMLPEYERTRLFENNWNYTEAGDTFITEFKKAIHVSTNTLDQKFALWVSMDFNITPASAVIGQKTNAGLFFNAEHQNDLGTKALCQDLQGYLVHPNALYATGDHSGTHGQSAAGYEGGEMVNDFYHIKKELRLSPFALKDTRTANKRHEYSRRLCNYVLKNVPCSFDPSLKRLIRDFGQAKVNNKEKIIKDRKDNKLDLFDAWRYLINAWFPEGVKDVDKYIKQIKSRQLAMSR